MAGKRAPSNALRVLARAHAKVNLDLRVLGTRPDGYHELRTVFQSIALHDTLLCVARPGPFALKCRTSGVPLDESNLVWRAAAALWTAIGRAGTPTDICRSLSGKRYRCKPGSAAAAPMPRRRCWPWRGSGAGCRCRSYVTSPAAIGADVPYFLSGGTALGLGRGEEIYPLVDLPTHWIVIVQPPYGISTAEAYAWYDEDRAAGSARAARAADAARAVADSSGSDDQRSRAARRPAASRDWRVQDRAARGWGRGRGDVG